MWQLWDAEDSVWRPFRPICGGIFILDTDILGGTDFNYVETIIEDRGRSITVNWSQSGLNEDIELLGYSIRFYPAETEPKEQV
jgi:hypothetical protein